MGEWLTSEDSQRFVAIPYNKKYNRFVSRIKRNQKYTLLKIVERDTLEAKLYFRYKAKMAGRKKK